MPFNDMYTQGTASYIGFRTETYCTVWWLVDGERRFKTVCYDQVEMTNAINIRTKLTQELQFEIEYTNPPIESIKEQAA